MDFVKLPEQKPVVGRNPDGRVVLCRGVPFSDSYDHVRLYDSRKEAAQDIATHFGAVDRSQVVPIRNGILDVSLPPSWEDALEFDYLIYWLHESTSRPEFFFIEETIPVSANSVRFRLKRDVWQNNIDSVKMPRCFVERKIVKQADDKIGAFTYPEGLELGEYIMHASGGTHLINDYQIPTQDDIDQGYSIMVATTFGNDGNFAGGNMREGVYEGINYMAFDTAGQVNEFLKDITEKGLSSGILTSFMFPNAFLTNDEAVYKRISIPKNTLNIDNYRPRNNKLFCYPYNYLIAHNNLGGVYEYRYEFFSTKNCEFEYTILVGMNPRIFAYPIKYSNAEQNYLNAIVYDNFAKCSMSIDTFKAWTAQTGANVAVSQLATAFNWSQKTESLAKGVAGFALAAMTGGVGGVQNLLQQATSASVAPPTNIGTGGGESNHQLRLEKIDFYQVTIRKEYAEIIDDFFSKYGYAINKFETPAIRTRKYWNYVKTRDICFTKKDTQTAQMGDLRALEEIFNKGVTIWHTTTDFGNYELENVDA